MDGCFPLFYLLTYLYIGKIPEKFRKISRILPEVTTLVTSYYSVYKTSEQHRHIKYGSSLQRFLAGWDGIMLNFFCYCISQHNTFTVRYMPCSQ